MVLDPELFPDGLPEPKESETTETQQEQEPEETQTPESETETQESEQQEQDSEKFVTKEKYKKYDVKFTREQQQKFNEVFASKMAWETQAKTLSKKFDAALDLIERIRDRQTSDDARAALGGLKQQIKDATEAGDYDRVTELTEKLVETKFEQQSKKEPSLKEQFKETEQEAPDVQLFTPEDTAYMRAKADETNPDGSLKRPWMRIGDPSYSKALQVANEIVNEYAISNRPLPISKLDSEIDRRMGGPRGAEVLGGGNLQKAPQRNTIKLSDIEKHVARKLGVPEEDYKKQKEKMDKFDRISIDEF